MLTVIGLALMIGVMVLSFAQIVSFIWGEL